MYSIQTGPESRKCLWYGVSKSSDVLSHIHSKAESKSTTFVAVAPVAFRAVTALNTAAADAAVFALDTIIAFDVAKPGEPTEIEPNDDGFPEARAAAAAEISCWCW